MLRAASPVLVRPAMAVIFVIALAGCSQTERGEKVFARQNQAASALATVIMESDARETASVDRLHDAESELHEACSALREAALLKMKGKSTGLGSEILILISLDHCAAETSRIEQLVRRTDPEVARFYLGATPVTLRPSQ